MGGVKDKIISLSKTNTFENYSKPARVKNTYGGQKKPRKQSEHKIIPGIKDRTIRNNRKLFEQEGEYDYKALRV